MKQGWEIKKLGEVCKFSQGVQVPIEEQYTTCEEGMIRFLRIIDFTQNGEAPRYINNVDDRYVLHDKEIAIVRYGTPGFVCYGKTGAIANNLFKILPKKEIFDFSFLKYWLSSDAFQGIVKGNKYGAALQAIKFSTINEILIPIPPIAEQEKIVSELDCLSGIIEKKRQQLKELDALAQSIFYEMFGNPVENEKGWDTYVLKDVSTLLNGRAYKQNELLSEGKYKVLRVGNFFTNGSYYYSDLELDEDKYCDNGDLLFAWSASFGAFIWNGEKVIYHYHIWKVLYDKQFLDIQYYRFLLNTMTNYFMKDVHGIGMVHLTKAGMEEESKEALSHAQACWTKEKAILSELQGLYRGLFNKLCNSNQ